MWRGLGITEASQRQREPERGNAADRCAERRSEAKESSAGSVVAARGAAGMGRVQRGVLASEHRRGQTCRASATAARQLACGNFRGRLFALCCLLTGFPDVRLGTLWCQLGDGAGIEDESERAGAPLRKPLVGSHLTTAVVSAAAPSSAHTGAPSLSLSAAAAAATAGAAAEAAAGGADDVLTDLQSTPRKRDARRAWAGCWLLSGLSALDTCHHACSLSRTLGS